MQGEVTALREDFDQQRVQASVAEQELAGMKGRLAEVSVPKPKMVSWSLVHTYTKEASI